MAIVSKACDKKYSLGNILDGSNKVTKGSPSDYVYRVKLLCSPDTGDVNPGFVYRNVPMKRAKLDYPDYMVSDNQADYYADIVEVTEHNMFYFHRNPERI